MPSSFQHWPGLHFQVSVALHDTGNCLQEEIAMLQTSNDAALLEKDDSIAALHDAQARLEASYEAELDASRAHLEEETGELYDEIDSLRSQVHALTEQVSELQSKLGQVMLSYLLFPDFICGMLGDISCNFHAMQQSKSKPFVVKSLEEGISHIERCLWNRPDPLNADIQIRYIETLKASGEPWICLISCLVAFQSLSRTTHWQFKALRNCHTVWFT